MDVHSLIKNMGAFVFSNTAGMLISFITGVYIARTLGAGPYGQISFAIAITTLFYYAVDLGTNYYSTTRVSSGKGSLMETVEMIYPLKAAMAVASFVLTCLIAFLFVPAENQLLVILYGASVFPVALAFDWTFQTTGMTKYAGAAKLLYTGSMLLMVVLFVTDPSRILLVPVFQFMGLVAASVMMYAIYRRLNGKPSFKFDGSKWREILRESIPFGLTGVMTMVAWYVPFIALQYARGDVDLGYFTAADQIISAGIAIYGWYFYCVYPMFVRTINDRNVVQNLSARFVFGTITPVCAGGCLLADQIIVFIFGDAFQPAGGLLVLMLVSLWVLEWNQIYIFGLFSTGKQALTTKIFEIQCVATVLLCIVLVPWLGAVGSCLAAIGCEVAGLPFFHKEFVKDINIDFSQIIIGSWIPTMVMLFAIIVLQRFVIDNMFVSIAFGAIVFIAVALGTQYVTKKDISELGVVV